MAGSAPETNTAVPPPADEPAGFGLPLDRIGLVLGPAAMAGWILLVDPGSLSPEAHRLAGIMLLTIIWWLTEPIPIPATGLAAVVLCVFLQVVPAPANGKLETAKEVLAPFALPTVFFLFGGLFIGRAMTRHGLDRRLALLILCTSWAGRSPANVLGAIGLGVTLVSMWISNTAATAMMFPVTMGIVHVLTAGSKEGKHGFARSPYASALLLMTAYASSVGGIATPVGTATNVFAIGFLRQNLGHGIEFARWSIVGIPMMLIIFLGLFCWLRLWAPADRLNMPALREYLQRERGGLGPWSWGERNTLIVFAVVVGMWITPGVLAICGADDWLSMFTSRFPEEVIALLAPVLLFLLPVNWRRREFTLAAADFQKIDWGTVLLFGAGLSLGGLMFKTGLANTVGQQIFDLVGTRDVWLITALAIAGGVVFSEFTGNTATASALLPVVLAVCVQADIDPVPPLMGATFGASFGSALPVSTMPNAIVYGSGLLPVRRMVVAGIGLDVLAAIAVWCVLRTAFALGWTPFGQ